MILVAGAAIAALSFADGWIAHDRELRGEGYRFVHVELSAWRSVAVPVLNVGVLIAIGTAVLAGMALSRALETRGWLLLGGAVLALSLIGASIVPIAQHGHASTVGLSAGWLTWVGIGLAGLMVVAATAVARPEPRLVVLIGMLGAVTFAAGAGGRWLGLQWKEGTGAHWSDGSYTRGPTAGEERETLTIDDGRFTIADRWSGTWESSGWTVVLDDDPACPGSRGAYHAHDEGPSGADLRFVKVVDTCLDGERAADLEAGIWERDP